MVEVEDGAPLLKNPPGDRVMLVSWFGLPMPISPSAYASNLIQFSISLFKESSLSSLPCIAGIRAELERSGNLGKIKAQIRADICHALEEPGQEAKTEALSRENLVLNELFREYLSFNGYGKTLSVLLPEAGQPEAAPFSREQLALNLGVREDEQSRKLPLLYSILAQCLERAEQDNADKDRLLRKMTMCDL